MPYSNFWYLIDDRYSGSPVCFFDSDCSNIPTLEAFVLQNNDPETIGQIEINPGAVVETTSATVTYLYTTDPSLTVENAVIQLVLRGVGTPSSLKGVPVMVKTIAATTLVETFYTTSLKPRFPNPLESSTVSFYNFNGLEWDGKDAEIHFNLDFTSNPLPSYAYITITTNYDLQDNEDVDEADKVTAEDFYSINDVELTITFLSQRQMLIQFTNDE